MPESFSLSRSACSGLTQHALQQEVQSRTGNELATEGILRSIERFGQDESIRYYEMIPQADARSRHSAATFSWIVRAVRDTPQYEQP